MQANLLFKSLVNNVFCITLPTNITLKLNSKTAFCVHVAYKYPTFFDWFNTFPDWSYLFWRWLPLTNCLINLSIPFFGDESEVNFLEIEHFVRNKKGRTLNSGSYVNTDSTVCMIYTASDVISMSYHNHIGSSGVNQNYWKEHAVSSY